MTFALPLRPLVLIVAACLPLWCQAAPVDALIEHAEQQNLATDNYWLRLLHMQTSGGDTPDYSSQVDDARFFLAKTGEHDPQAELNATLRGLFNDTPQGDQHIRCRYPARLSWLARQLDFSPEQLPSADCAEYQEWRGFLRAEQVTLVFPAYYLNSPSSMFGHTLLRLDPAGDSFSEWLSFAVNFGANVQPDDNSLFYAFKGLTGGYNGTFNVEQYYKKIKTYNGFENRDIWEYPLNLTPTETERMVLHLWELKEINFKYFFFDENCSYRVLELLEIARPEVELTDRFGINAIPIDTAKAVLDSGMGSQRQYRPAKMSVLKQQLSYIPPRLHRHVLGLSQDANHADSASFQGLDKPMQARIVQTAYKYLRQQQSGKARDDAIAATSFALLKLLRRYADVLPKDQPAAPSPPDLAHGSHRISGALMSDDDEFFVNLGLRLSLHSLEERSAGFLRGAQINIGNFVARLGDNTAKLERIDLVDIFSLTARDDFFKPISWKIKTGLERERVGGQDKQVTHVSGGAGMAWDWHNNLQIHALATARLEHNSVFSHALEPAGGVLTGLLWHFDQHTARFELAGEKFANGTLRRRLRYSHNLVLAPQHAVSWELQRRWYEHDNSTRFGVRYHYYFAP